MSTPARSTRSSAVKAKLISLDDLPKKTPAKKGRVSKKLDLSGVSEGDKENTTPKASRKKVTPKSTAKKTTPKKSTKKKVSTPRSSEKKPKKASTPKSSGKKPKKASTPKSSEKKPKTASTPKSSEKKKKASPKTPRGSTKKQASPKKDSAKKSPASPKVVTENKGGRPKGSVNKVKASPKASTPKASSSPKVPTPKASPQAPTASPKASTPKASTAKKTKAPTPKSSGKKTLSSKVRTISKKIATGSATTEELAQLFNVPAMVAAEPKAATPKKQEEKIVVQKLEAVAAEPSTPSSSDLTVMCACTLFSLAAAHWAPAQLEGKLPKIGPIDNTAAVATALICMVIFTVGFQFALRWSRSKEHAVQVYRVSFGFASVIAGCFLCSCCEQKFRACLTTASLGFAAFELVHVWNVESVSGYFRIAITALIGLWSLMLIASKDKAHVNTVEYNTYLLLIFTVGNILASTDAIHVHFTIGTYLVAALSIFVWAVKNGKIPTADISQPIKMAVLTFSPTLLAILDNLKTK